MIKELFHGAVFGVANIIPGVSGGTLALVLGFYERLITAIHHISPTTLGVCINFFRFNRESADRLRDELKRIDAFFLARLGLGALIAIVALAKLMTYLLLEWHDPTYGFFFGLVLISVVSPYRLIVHKSISVFGAILVGAVFIWGLDNAVSGNILIEKARMKHTTTLQKTERNGDARAPVRDNDQKRNPVVYLGFFTMGAIAISGMILPGISGSFLLLLMGGYFEILAAIVSRDFLLLGAFVLGCVVGIVLFTRILHYLLTTFHDCTLGTLVGLVLGSLWIIWPFKHTTLVGEETVYLDNRLPSSLGLTEWTTIIAAIVGMAVVSLLIKLEKE